MNFFYYIFNKPLDTGKNNNIFNTFLTENDLLNKDHYLVRQYYFEKKQYEDFLEYLNKSREKFLDQFKDYPIDLIISYENNEVSFRLLFFTNKKNGILKSSKLFKMSLIDYSDANSIIDILFNRSSNYIIIHVTQNKKSVII